MLLFKKEELEEKKQEVQQEEQGTEQGTADQRRGEGEKTTGDYQLEMN